MTKANKVLFITQEITPYVSESEMSLVGRNLPQAIQEKGREIRKIQAFIKQNYQEMYLKWSEYSQEGYYEKDN